VRQPRDEVFVLPVPAPATINRGLPRWTIGGLLVVVERELGHRSREHAFDPSAERAG
jgi:hypothetical protein